MSYILKHWRGEHSLAMSFWLNVLLINICCAVFYLVLVVFPIDNPVVKSQVAIILFFVIIVIIYPWQSIGLWRSASRHAGEKKKRFWASTAKVLVVFGIFSLTGNVIDSWPMYKDLYQTGFGKDEFGNYKVELTKNGELIHMKGALGSGIAKEVKQLVAKNPNVKGIILDSLGGRTYEARKLSKVILINSLDTYTFEGCDSACGTAFISGNKRYLAKGARLGFHQYELLTTSFAPYLDDSPEQKKALKIYQRRGISQDFIDKIFKAKNDEMWYPTIEELLDAGVIHGVVNPSNLKQYQESNSLLNKSSDYNIQQSNQESGSASSQVNNVMGGSTIFYSQTVTWPLCEYSVKFPTKTEEKSIIFNGVKSITVQSISNGKGAYMRAECLPLKNPKDITSRFQSVLEKGAKMAGLTNPTITIKNGELGTIGTYFGIKKGAGQDAKFLGKLIIGEKSVLTLLVADKASGFPSEEVTYFLGSVERKEK